MGGGSVCSALWTDGYAIGGRIGRDGPGSVSLFGTDRGHLRSVDLDCGTNWASDPVDTGTKISWSYLSTPRVLGPEIIHATVRFQVEGMGVMEVYLLGHSSSSVNGTEAGSFEFLLIGLSVWDNTGLYR